MGNYITLNRKKHISLLADHRVDPVTKELLKVGDEVCCCAKCKTVYSKNVWIGVKNHTCCDQRKTLTEIPNIEYANFQKKPDKSTKSDDSYGCAFVFFLITTIAFAIAAYYYYTMYEEEKNIKNELYNKSSTLNKKYIKIEKEQKKRKKQLSQIRNLNFRIGKKDVSGSGGYDQNWLMFLEVKYPIRLNHLYVQPFETGYVTIKLYDFNDNLIHSKRKYLTNPKNLNKVNLDFKIPKKGKYYLKFEGEISLWYNTIKASEYRQYTNDILKIIGCGTTKEVYTRVSYYQYFYDLNYSILTD